MADRVARLEEKVDKMTSLLTDMAKEVRGLKTGQAGVAPEIQPEVAPYLMEPTDPYSLYCKLFDDWVRGDDRSVVKRLNRMSVAELRQLVDAARMPVTEKSDKAKLLAEMKAAFRDASVKARGVQCSGLYCLLESEWNAGNSPFVEGRLNELDIEQLRGVAATGHVKITGAARRASLIRAIMKILEEKRPRQPPPSGPKRAHNPQAEHYQYMHSVLFNEWAAGNIDYVNTQLNNLTLERLQAYIRANKLTVREKSDKAGIIEEIRGILGRLQTQARTQQYIGLYLLLAQEWKCGNRSFVDRRLDEMSPEKLLAFAGANSIVTGGKTGKTTLVKAIRAHLKAQAG